MTFNEFTEKILIKIDERLWPEEEAVFKKIKKNNDLVLSGIVIRERGKNIAPTIYIDDFYKKYRKCKEYNIDIVVRDILNLAREKRNIDCFDVGFYENYENIKSNMYLKLINKEMNEKLLSEIPYKSFLDLVQVVYCDVSDCFGLSATILVTNDQLTMWDIEKSRLFDDARNNTFVRERTNFFDFGSYIKNSSGAINKMTCPIDEDMLDCTCNFNILSNVDFKYGAINMANTHILDELCEKFSGDIMIIPSSIHEVIIIPYTEDIKDNVKDMDEYISEINRTELNKDDILSNHAYFYSKERGYFY